VNVKTDQCQWDENLFWFKFLCTGQGFYCPGCPGYVMDGAVKPICYNQQCCLESACGLRNGKYAGCVCDPMTDFWCADRCCCFKDYCAMPWMGNEQTKTWFQLCCIAVEQPFSFKFINPMDQFTTGFCWFRCCCSGTGMECEGITSDPMKFAQPISESVWFCTQSTCGLYQGSFMKCFPDPMNEPWCKSKDCCIQSYCGIGQMLAEPCQLCPLLIEGGCGGAAFEPIKSGDATVDEANMI